jgi:DnaJ-domain-containing protein 1
MDDEGVAVYFMLDGNQQCIPCDKWSSVKDNVRAIGLTVQALRGLDRWGAKEMVSAAFRGFKALPETAIVTPYTKRPWYDVLEVSQTASPETIRAAYKAHLFKAHPDHGGTSERLQELRDALEESGI